MEEQEITNLERVIKDLLVYIIRNFDGLSIYEISKQIEENIDAIKKLGKYNKLYLQLINNIQENENKDFIMKKIIDILNNTTFTNENYIEDSSMIVRSQIKVRNNNKFDIQQLQKRKNSLEEVNIIL